MKRSECQAEMGRLCGICCEHDLSYAIIFHQDKMTGEVHSTYMLSNDEYELNYWASRRSSDYRKLEVPFAAYIDGALEDCNNKLVLED
jgi:hypothetical protein